MIQYSTISAGVDQTKIMSNEMYVRPTQQSSYEKEDSQHQKDIRHFSYTQEPIKDNEKLLHMTNSIERSIVPSIENIQNIVP